VRKTVIIGAGLTGLSCGYKLKKKLDYLLIEKEKKAGGLCSSVSKNGFVFDYSGHLLHLRWEETKNFVLGLLKNNQVKIKRNAQIYLKGYYIDYPFQINLYNLPPEIKSKCVSDFLKANIYEKKQTENFKEWAIRTFGKSICEYFMFPYNEKLFSYPLEKLTTLWLGNFVPRPDIKTVLEGAYIGKVKNLGYNYEFYYPKRGGINHITQKLAGEIKEKIMTDSEVKSVSFKTKEIVLKNGEKIKYSKLINTTPLKDFILISDAPQKVKEAAKKLKHNTVYILNIGIKKTNFKQHWIYFPQKTFPFYRLGFYTNFSRYLAPENSDSLYAEVSVYENEFIDIEKTQRIIINQIKRLCIIKDYADIKTLLWTKADCGYVIYDFEREKALKIIFDYLNQVGVISIGRYGGWKYSFMEENIKEGFEAAKEITGGSYGV